MKPTPIALLLAFAGASSAAQAADTLRVDVGRGSAVWIEGSSNVADWRCRASAFEARLELDAPRAVAARATAAGLRAINVKVAVRDLKCGNRKMEHDLYAALNASDPSKPSFILGRFDVLADADTGNVFTTRGALAVAGVEQVVTVPVSTDVGADGEVRARGAVMMRMTDFGIKPPTGLFGLIRSRNEITVKFDLVVPPRTLAGLR